MFLINAFKAILKQKDYEDAAHFRHGWENAKMFQEVVFTSIECVVILAAIEIATGKQSSITLSSIYIVAWIALFTYILMFAKYFINVTNEKFNLIKSRTAFSWLAGTLSLCMSWGLVFYLPRIVAAFVSINFMQ